MNRNRKKPYIVPDLVTQSTAAKMIGVTRQAIVPMIARGQLEAVVVAGTPMVLKASAEKLADERRASGRLAA